MTGTSIRTRIFNKVGAAIAEIKPEYTSITWRLNAAGRAEFKLAYRDSACTPDNLALGNRVLIQFSNGLPDWGGVIDVPRRQTPVGVEVKAHSAEHILSWRVTGKAVYFSNSTPGMIYRSLIQQMNARYASAIEPGNIETAGTPRSAEYHHHELLNRIKDLAHKAGHDFDVTPAITSGALRFYANWYITRGTDKSDSVWLIDEDNADVMSLDLQGNIASRVLQIGEGQTWGDERQVAEAQDLDSQAAYDYREWAETTSVIHEDTLQDNADNILDVMKEPRTKFTATASNVSPALFANYAVGDIVQLKAFAHTSRWGYDAPVRVMGREWRQDNICRLELEEA